MRSRLLAMGIIGCRQGVATTSSAPVSFLRAAFAALFDPALNGPSLLTAVAAWQTKHLASSTLERMALKAQGALARQGDVFIELPDGKLAAVAGK